MDIEDDISQLRIRLGANSDWYPWVSQYGITNHVMAIGLHRGTYPNYVALLLSGCDRFSGPLQGGPFRLEVRASARGSYELVSIDGLFSVTFDRIRLDENWRPERFQVP